MRVTVLGGGSWGTALANHMAGKGYQVTMLVREAQVASDIKANHRNPDYLPGTESPARGIASTRPAAALEGQGARPLQEPRRF